MMFILICAQVFALSFRGLHGEQVIVTAGPGDQPADIDGLDGTGAPAGHH